MRPEWQLPSQTSLPSQAPDWAPSRVLIQYDGPQLVTLPHRGSNFLGIAVDESDHAVRWILAEITSLEYEGLVRGGASIRSAISKERVLVVDFAPDYRKLGVWELNIRDVPPVVLPEPGVPLPSSVRQRFRNAELPQPVFVLGSERVPFGDLSVFLGQIQKFWNVAAQAVGDTFSVLSATALAPGSLTLQVYTDNVALFERVAERYRELAIVTDDAQALSEKLNEEPAAIASAYREYIHAIADHGIEVLAKWGDGGAYLGPSVVERTEEELVAVLDQQEEEPTVETVQYRGYFKGFWIKTSPRFEFHDIQSGEEFTGRIDSALKQAMAKQGRTLILGRQAQLYDVSVDIQRVPEAPPKYILKQFDPVPLPDRK